MTTRSPKIPKKTTAPSEKLHSARYLKTPYAIFLAGLILLPLAFYGMRLINQGLAFQGPSSASGVGTGAVGIDTNNNLSVGSSNPISDTKFFVLGSSTASTGFVVKIVQPGTTQTFSHSGQVPGNPLLLIRNDGKVGIAGFIGDTTTSTVVIGGNTRVDGVVAATSFTGAWTGTASAGNVSAGNFAANTGGGNFAFPASLGVGTTNTPAANFEVLNSLGSTRITGSQIQHYYNSEANPRWVIDRDGGGSGLAGIKFGPGGGTALNSTFAHVSGGGFALTGGNVGIGTTGPTSLLHVAGSSAIARIQSTSAGNNAELKLSYLDSDTHGVTLRYNPATAVGYIDNTYPLAAGQVYGDLHFRQNVSGTLTTRMIIKADGGNVGIGTTSPYAGSGITALTINATSYPSLALQTGGTLRGLVWATTGDLRVEASGALPTIFWNNNAETMRITSGGNVQVGENAAYGDVRFAVTDSAGDNDSTFLTVKRDGTTNPVFSILPWDSNVYIGVGVYYSNGAWVHNSDDTNSQLLIMDPGAGVYWYASNNSSGSWNVASNVQLWDSAGNGTFPSLTIGGGTGKINAGTIDPIYTINGVNYATYMAGMTGVKEETTGVLQIPCDRGVCRHVIDFKKAAKGSDFWLFAKASDLPRHMDQMAVILSPAFDGKVWYEKLDGKLVVSARAEGGQSAVEVSYRLTAPRFDADEWSNYNNDIGAKGFVIND